jgi:hypothetical protein
MSSPEFPEGQICCCGGLAIIHFGYVRATGDIDLLVEDSPENIVSIKKALAYIPDGEVDQIAETDLGQYQVVRISGEITVDLLAKAGEVTYSTAKDHIHYEELNGVSIPFWLS